MAKDMRAALANRATARDKFDFSPLMVKPGQRAMPGALLVERRFLIPDPEQPRKVFDEERLADLSESFKQVGILQPLRVRSAEEEGFYFIVNGERRWRAAGLADINEVPVVVRDSPADVRAFEMLVENLQRENLSDEEEAAAYTILIDQGYTVEQIAARLGVSAARVSRNHRIFSHDHLAPAVVAGQLTKSQAQELLTAPHDLQAELVELVAGTQGRGQAIPQTELRLVVREINAALDAGETPQDVMESIALRNAFHNGGTPVAAHVRRASADRAADELAAKLDLFLRGFRAEQVDPGRLGQLDALIEAYRSWRGPGEEQAKPIRPRGRSSQGRMANDERRGER